MGLVAHARLDRRVRLRCRHKGGRHLSRGPDSRWRHDAEPAIPLAACCDDLVGRGHAHRAGAAPGHFTGNGGVPL